MILPGNYKINTVSIISTEGRKQIDLTAIYTQLNIFESIMTNCITGYLTVTDTYNLISGKNYALPIMGNEIIYIEAELPAYYIMNEKDEWVVGDPNVITYYGRVFDIKNLTLINEGAQNYEIHFCSEEMILSENLKISQSYKEKPFSDILTSIFNDNFKNNISSYEFERTLNNHTVVMPNWNPLKAINWLASRSVSAAHKTTPFFFYQSLYNDGSIVNPQNNFGKSTTTSSSKYWFISLDEMIAMWGGDVRKTIFYAPANNNSIYKPTDPESYMRFSNALNYEVTHSFDTLANTSSGMYASRMVTHDITTKSYKETNYTYEAEFQKYKYHVDNAGFFTGVKNSQGKTFSSPDYCDTHTMMTSSGTYETPNYLDTISYSRINRLQSLNTYRLNLLVPGDGLVEPGDLIEFKMRSLEVGDNGKTYDEFYNGKYLVNSIRHMFTRKEYKMTLDCSKESLNKEVRGYTASA